MEDTKNSEVEEKEYIIDIVAQLIYKGENYPDKAYVVKPIEDYIIKKVNAYKHSHRIKGIDIDIVELDENDKKEDEAE